jgi:hypothetical protein
MKNLMMKISTMLAMVAIFAMAFSVSSCDKDDDETPPPVIVLDGLYVTGSATAYTDLNSNAMMKITKNENGQKIDSSLFELYIPLTKGTNTFKIVKVAGSVQTTYGPAAGFGVVTTPTNDEPKVPFQRGPVTAGSTATFTVPSDGMYHVVFDVDYLKVAVIPVHWGMIGAATPGGWSNDTDLTESAFNATEMSWTITNLVLQKGDWKFRYSHGWKVEIDTTDVDNTKWVKVNTNFGGAVTALVPGGDNIANGAPGKYTCTISYKLGTGYTATLTKTGELDPINYSTYEMGMIGDAYNKADGTPANWDENFGTQVPVVSGTDYTWTYTLDLFADKQFKFRQGSDWSGKSIGFADVTMAGAAAGNFSDSGGDHNFKISATGAGNYTLVLKIQAVGEIYTLTATKN